MPSTAVAALRGLGGVATWHQLTAMLPAHLITHAAAAGQIVRVLPRVYAIRGDVHSAQVRFRAALLFGGSGSCLSHTTALAQWPRLHVPSDGRVHILTPSDRDRRSTGYVAVHRCPGRTTPSDLITVRNGLPVCVPAMALLDAWNILTPAQRRAPVIDAFRLGLTDAAALARHLHARPKLRGRAELRRLVELLGEGCQSELEIMGFSRVFADRRLPRSRRQFPVTVGGHRYVLDIAWPELLLAVELDGAHYHRDDEARERDVRRDAVLARAGWQTIRLTYSRLAADPAAVVTELVQIIAMRRQQLGHVA